MALNKIFRTDEYLQYDADAGGVITPGHLVETNSSGDLVVHATAAAPAMPHFARKIEYADVDGTDPIDVDYASGDFMKSGIAQRGCRVYALIAANENIAIGDLLVSAGDGTLREYVPGGTAPDDAAGVLARAVEAATGTADFRCTIEVL